MALRQAPAAVRGIDAAMPRQVEGPNRMYRRAQRDVVDHVRLRQKKTSSDANSSRKIKFLILPEKSGGWIEETTLPLIKLRRDFGDAADLVGPAGARFSP
jgi:hypothetical protein